MSGHPIGNVERSAPRSDKATEAPTGKAVELRWASAYEVNGAALTSEHLYFDQMDLLSQLGLLPD